jgi:transcription initiation factor TFIIIB Brf1 subunit/transcription initiation factor TFIIB
MHSLIQDSSEINNYKLKNEIINNFDAYIKLFTPESNSDPKSENKDFFCENCSKLLVISKGIEKCNNCGIIYSNSIDYGAEWRNDIENGEDKTRCGAPINPMLLQTSYSSGFSLGPFANRKVYQTLKRAWFFNSKPHAEKSLEARFDNIEYKCKLYNIPNYIIETAKKIYYDIINQELEKDGNMKTRGSSNAGLQAAAVYFAFQDDNQPKTYKEIAYIFDIDSHYVSNGITKFKLIMEKLDKYSYINNIINYNDYIYKYCNRLFFEPYLIKQTIDLINYINTEQLLDNNTPNAIIAGSIYYIIIINGLDKITKKTIETMCNISGPTIVKICEKLILNPKLIELTI